jgi:hypothetical protein
MLKGRILKTAVLARENQDHLYMKDAKGVTGNEFDAGSAPSGMIASAFRLKNSIEERLGIQDSQNLGIDADIIILEGGKKDYQFTFNPPNPETKEDGGVTIKHVATGATNLFTGYDYVVFGGREKIYDRANYVKMSNLKAEQEASKAVENTQKVVPGDGASGHGLDSLLPSGKEEDRCRDR